MGEIAQQESFVKDSLIHFITQNVPDADLSLIDDIVLSYVISILEEVGEEAAPAPDVESFIEMMGGYVPEFAQIDPEKVCAWVVEVGLGRTDKDSENDYSEEKENLNLSLSDMLPQAAPKTVPRSRTNSECWEGAESSTRRAVLDCDEYAEQCRVLHEMFPNSCAMEIKHCVSIANGDLERATATLLHRREQGQALAPAALSAAARQPLCDDHEMKNRIIARYSYVDKNSENREHRPVAPRVEPRKMVRYRDNRIVSLRGERYTDVTLTGSEDEILKKPKKPGS
ncbi:hypothetical protein ACJJTC_019033 [Scirpophaga incertulas]